MRKLTLLTLALGLTGLTAVTAAEALSEPVAQKVMKADIEYLEKGLAKEPQKREIPTLKAAAMLLALNAQESKAGYRDRSLEVAAAITKKDYAKAKADLAGLADAKGSSDAKNLAEENKFDLHELMSCFRASTVGGLNLEKDVKAYGKKIGDLDKAEVVAGRVALIAVYTKDLPPAEAAGESKKKQWDDLSDEMGKIAHEILKQTQAGGGADLTAIEKNFVKLNANCNACHTAFRN